MTIRASDRNGRLVDAHSVMETDSIMLITANGQMIRMRVRDVRIIGRVTQGVKLIDLDEGDMLVSATPLEPESDDENGDSPGATTEAENNAERPTTEPKPDAGPENP